MGNRRPKNIEIGMFFHLMSKGISYQITGIGPGGSLILTKNYETGEEVEFTYEEFLDQADLFALSMDGLRKKLIMRKPETISPPEGGLPAHLLNRAKREIAIVQRVRAKLDERENDIMRWGETEVLKQVVETEDISLSTYYNHRKRYNEANGDVNVLASSYHRKTFGQIKITKAQEHFLDQLILDYPTQSPSDVFKVGHNRLERTGGLWVDPEKCESVPEDLVIELTDSRIPMSTILSNPDKKGLLVPISLVSRSFFYDYHRGLTAQPDLGRGVG